MKISLLSPGGGTHKAVGDILWIKETPTAKWKPFVVCFSPGMADAWAMILNGCPDDL